MVEQRPFKPLVGGSSPPAPTTILMGLSHMHSAILAITQLHTPNTQRHTPASLGHILDHLYPVVAISDIFMAEKNYCL